MFHILFSYHPIPPCSNLSQSTITSSVNPGGNPQKNLFNSPSGPSDWLILFLFVNFPLAFVFKDWSKHLISCDARANNNACMFNSFWNWWAASSEMLGGENCPAKWLEKTVSNQSKWKWTEKTERFLELNLFHFSSTFHRCHTHLWRCELPGLFFSALLWRHQHHLSRPNSPPILWLKRITPFNASRIKPTKISRRKRST